MKNLSNIVVGIFLLAVVTYDSIVKSKTSHGVTLGILLMMAVLMIGEALVFNWKNLRNKSP